MTLTHANFNDVASQTAQQLAELFTDWTTPHFFLHCCGGFDLNGLFDAPPQTLPLKTLAGFPETPDTDGNTPQLLYGNCHELSILVQAGTWRLSDGHGLLPELLPIAIARAADISNAVFIDCALSLNPDLKAGHWGMLTDFINGFAFSPLDGLHHLLDHPFPNLAETLNQFQNSEIINALGDIGEMPLLCTFLGRPGFHLFTPAEIKVAHAQGADFIGHDLPLLLTFAHAMGLRVSCLVLAGAQLAPGEHARRLARQDFLEAAHFRSPQLTRALRHAIAEIEHRPQDETEPASTVPPEISSSDAPDADELLAASIRRAATRTSPLSKFLKK